VRSDLKNMQLKFPANCLAWVAFIIAFTGTSVLFIRPIFIQQKIIMVHVVVSLCWAIYFGTVVIGLLVASVAKYSANNPTLQTNNH
jgi:hypothetical protein